MDIDASFTRDHGIMPLANLAFVRILEMASPSHSESETTKMVVSVLVQYITDEKCIVKNNELGLE